MTSLSSSIIAKSEQLNADDLIGRSITIEITEITGRAGDQPIAISYRGDDGKPWFPCKSMRRVLVFVWGENGEAYVGRKLTLYRDEKVKFGGVEVGGIRISHMSHMEKAIMLALTVTRANKKPCVVHPLVEAKPAGQSLDELKAEARTVAYTGTATFRDYWKSLGRAKQELLEPSKDELKSIAASCDVVPDDSGAAA
jgi:hypothetical protein